MRQITVQDAEPRDISIQGDLAAAGIRPSRSVHVRETYCLTCNKSGAFPTRVVGRWDYEREATAIPFEPVAVSMSCGCVVGDPSLAEPSRPIPPEERRPSRDRVRGRE